MWIEKLVCEVFIYWRKWTEKSPDKIGKLWHAQLDLWLHHFASQLPWKVSKIAWWPLLALFFCWSAINFFFLNSFFSSPRIQDQSMWTGTIFCCVSVHEQPQLQPNFTDKWLWVRLLVKQLDLSKHEFKISRRSAHHNGSDNGVYLSVIKKPLWFRNTGHNAILNGLYSETSQPLICNAVLE